MAMGAKPLRDLVDLVGFEPTTSSMPWKRAPNCATGPLAEDISIFAYPFIIVKHHAQGEGVMTVTFISYPHSPARALPTGPAPQPSQVVARRV
jgi:hypothetical protein